jgi:hypothetical protein
MLKRLLVAIDEKFISRFTPSQSLAKATFRYLISQSIYLDTDAIPSILDTSQILLRYLSKVPNIKVITHSHIKPVKSYQLAFVN